MNSIQLVILSYPTVRGRQEVYCRGKNYAFNAQIVTLYCITDNLNENAFNGAIGKHLFLFKSVLSRHMPRYK